MVEHGAEDVDSALDLAKESGNFRKFNFEIIANKLFWHSQCLYLGNQEITDYLQKKQETCDTTLFEAVSKSTFKIICSHHSNYPMPKLTQSRKTNDNFHGISDNIEDVKKCIKSQDINGLNEDGKSALHLAALNGTFESFN